MHRLVLPSKRDTIVKRIRWTNATKISVDVKLIAHKLFLSNTYLIRTLQQPHISITHKCNGQLQEAECTIIHTRQ